MSNPVEAEVGTGGNPTRIVAGDVARDGGSVRPAEGENSGVPKRIRHPAGHPITVLLAALAAAVVTWWGVERYFSYRIEIPHQLAADMTTLEMKLRFGAPGGRGPYVRTAADNAMIAEVQSIVRRGQLRNSVLVVGAFGLLLALKLSVVEWWHTRGRYRKRMVLVAALFAGLVGGIGGFVARVALNEWSFQGINPMLVTMAVHSIAWCSVGVGVGTAISLESGWLLMLRTAFTAKLGGLVAGLSFTPLASVVYPLTTTIPLVPEGPGSRLIWLLLAALCIAFCPLLVANSSTSPAVARHSNQPASRG